MTSRWWFYPALIAVSLLLVAAGVGALTVVLLWPNLPSLEVLTDYRPKVPLRIYSAEGELMGEFGEEKRAVVRIQDVPQHMKAAILAAEDDRFYQHGGVDYMGLLRAAVKDVLHGGGIQGGSTLTMQLVTNVYLPNNITHNLKYKIVQAKLATELEDKKGKQWILTQYLNDVPYGTEYHETAIGVAAASQMFFNKPVNKLDLAQIALLAGLPQAPTSYNPFANPSLARWRRGLVLNAMAQSGYITRAQAQAAQAQGLQVKRNDQYQTIRQPYVVDYVEQQLVKLIPQWRLDQGGLKIYTTINLADQQAAAQAIQANEGHPGDPAVSLVSVDPTTGDIVALQNSTNYGTGKNETTFDYATQGRRQTGSSFKPFVLMTLIHNYDGDPNSTYYVSKFLPAGWLPGYPKYSVATSELSYLGTVNVTRATALSDNTVYAQLGVDVGMQNVDKIAHAMGITSPLSGNPAEAIGGLHIGVSALQMSDAYATLANGGDHVDPTIISKVVDSSGKTIYTANPHKTQVFTPGEAYAGTQTLETVLQYGTGTAANYGCPAAGKTGTTENYTDAWFVGYTPKLSTAVWVGYPKSEVPMTDVNGLGPGFGGTLAAPIWRQFMLAASGGYCGDFTPPAQYWHGVEYFGPHAVSAYVPPPVTTTSTSTNTTGSTTSTTGGTPANPNQNGQSGGNQGGGTGGNHGGNRTPLPPSASGGTGF